MSTILSILVVCLIMSPMVIAQEVQQTKEEPKKLEISEDFLNTWKKVGDMTKEIRSFKTEKAVTVAGVRGAEAEDKALKSLYYKGGVKYPSRLELKNAIELLVTFVNENPDDPTVPQCSYFIAQCHIQLGDIDKGTAGFNNIIERFPTSEYAELAKEELGKIKKQK